MRGSNRTRMEKVSECYLDPLDDGASPIKLPNSECVTVGRALAYITDPICPRIQVILVADFEHEVVNVRRSGLNPSLLDGKCLKKNVDYVAKNQMILEIVPGVLKYRIVFTKAKVSPTSVRLKRQRDSPALSPLSPKKKMKTSAPQVGDNADSAKKPGFALKWSDYDRRSLIICKCEFDQVFRPKVAAFDLDGTLIKTRSGNVFPKDKHDWQLWDPVVKTTLKKLFDDGYLVVVFSNQGSLKYQDRILPFKEKIENIIAEIDVPMFVFISTNDDIYRKPAPGMWNYLLNEIQRNGNIVSVPDSFYVGDAAGRVDGWGPGRRKDFSVSDRLFARNLSLKFHTPEEYFLKKLPARFEDDKFHPGVFTADKYEDLQIPPINPDYHEVIAMVGAPASGKSFFVNSVLKPKGYVVINRDTLGTWTKCAKLLESSIRKKNNVVVDNTNCDADSRKNIIELCKKYNVPVRCFVMDVCEDRCQHNNRFRQLIGSDHLLVAPRVLRLYYSRYEEPTLEEGFSDVIKIPFVPKFSCAADENLYKQYLITTKHHVVYFKLSNYPKNSVCDS